MVNTGLKMLTFTSNLTVNTHSVHQEHTSIKAV